MRVTPLQAWAMLSSIARLCSSLHTLTGATKAVGIQNKAVRYTIMTKVLEFVVCACHNDELGGRNAAQWAADRWTLGID